MARIIRGRIEDGDTVEAADLNTRFGDFNQTTLNQFNHRDAAHDLPQFVAAGGLFLLNSDETTIGKSDVYHAAPVSVSGQTSMPANAVPIEDGAGTPTVLDLGASGITVKTTELLRVYYNLSVCPKITSGTPSRSGFSFLTFDEVTSGTTTLSDNVGCWLLYLEWDITDNTLANFVPVPKQNDYTTNFTGVLYGDKLEDSMSVVPIPAWVDSAAGASVGGKVDAATRSQQEIGWRGVSGAYLLNPSTNRTIYGLRVVVKGLMHSYNTGGINYLIHDPTPSASCTLEYTSGKLGYLHHTLG